MIVLDASLVMAWLLAERSPSLAPEVYDALPSEPMIVPAHWPAEISNVLRTCLRTGRISLSDLEFVLDQFARLHVHIEQPVNLNEIGPLTLFANTHGLTAYDAIYLQLALRRQAILATLDGEMRAAAGQLNIPVLPA